MFFHRLVHYNIECFRYIMTQFGYEMGHVLWDKVEGVEWNGGRNEKFCKKSELLNLMLLAITK
jgi:hypothetical protein